VLSKCNTKNGQRRATEFRTRINDLAVTYGGSIIPVRASIGTTAFDGEAEVAELLCRADNAMYAQKRGNGRQHVRSFEASLAQGRFNGAAE
jgi:GGDEF domain-containing protein